MTIDQHLARSQAADGFREALGRFLRSGRPNERIVFDSGSPPVKVERALVKALVEYPDLAIESIEFRAVSGCEYYRGHAVVRTAAEERVVKFAWDCKWKAQQMGWSDWFGFPDQARAAREFGWDCFRTWDEESAAPLGVAIELPQGLVTATETDAVPA